MTNTAWAYVALCVVGLVAGLLAWRSAALRWWLQILGMVAAAVSVYWLVLILIVGLTGGVAW